MTNEKGNNRSIIIIEDEPILGKVCSRLMELNGYKVTLVANGLIAKNTIDGQHFDFCLSDIKTPVMNGMELYKYLLEKHPALAKKTLFMTGDVMSRDVEEFFTKNNAPYILKPFSNSQLFEVIAKHFK
jgi:CheY-like chemotaxis protein